MEMSDSGKVNSGDRAIDLFRAELIKTPISKRRKIIEKFILAALGSIPWVGGFLSAAASLKVEPDIAERHNLQTQWLEEHAKKIDKLKASLEEILQRFETLGDQIEERIKSEDYLALVRRTFRVWDQADSDDKRKYLINLISNAAGTRLCSDDVVRLFTDWLNTYHEAHFMVIREIYRNPGATRFEIWEGVHGVDSIPADDSADADLFKLFIRDLSTGGVIRQVRETNSLGQFVRQRQQRRRSSLPTTLESAFEDTKPYVLTALGQQFVHYTMNEVVPRISQENS